MTNKMHSSAADKTWTSSTQFRTTHGCSARLSKPPRLSASENIYNTSTSALT